MQKRKILLSTSLLFVFTSFILVIISTAGSTANYSPLNNIYIGDADISHINITKVLPQLGPLALMLGSILNTYPESGQEVFSTLKNVSNSDALIPFLTIVLKSENTTKTLEAVGKLAPLALSSGAGSSTAMTLTSINNLLKESKNSTATMEGLSNLVADQDATANSTSSITTMLQSFVFKALENSKNASATTDALIDVMDIPVTDLITLLPLLKIAQYSTNISATLQSAATLMAVDIPTMLATQLTSILDSAAKADNITAAFAPFETLIPTNLKASMAALETLIGDSSNKTATISSLETIIKTNLTQSDTAKNVMADLNIITAQSSNTTELFSMLSSVMPLVNGMSGSAGASSMLSLLSSATTELKTLGEVLDASNNSTGSVYDISSLESNLSSDSKLAEYTPYLFEFLNASSDPAASFQALVNITQLGATNPSFLLPLLKVLNMATTAGVVTDEELYVAYPTILDALHIPAKLRIAIFTLCEVNIKGDVTKCSSPHAVQNFDFRSIIFQILLDSDFAPYIKALNYTADDLHLDGRLQNEQHQYVPTVKAALAMNILSIITAFFMFIVIACMLARPHTLRTNIRWFFFILWCMTYCCFTGLGTTVVTAMVNIIKSGTAHDKYNVIVKTNVPTMGLTWSAFTLSVLSCCLLMCAWFLEYKDVGRIARESAVTVESTSGTSDNESQTIKKEFIEEKVRDDI